MRFDIDTPWIRAAIVVTLAALVMASCNCESEPEAEPEVDEVVDDDGVDDEDADRPRQAFGLPLPPEYDAIRQEEQRVRVTTSMDLDELEEFYAGELVDYEILRPGDRLRVEPLRTHSARIEASHFRGPASHVVVNYRRPPQQESSFYQRPPIDEPDDEESEDDAQDRQEVADAQPQQPRRMAGPEVVGERPGWLDDIKGEPVELRTPDGELLAPEAKWGEPYTPPEGSPLDEPRFQHNFGRPFGDWRSR